MPTLNGPFQDAFQLGPWQVYPRRHCLIRDETVVHVEPKVMQVLLRLAQAPGQTVTRDELVADVWMGVIVTDEAVTRAVSTLRKALEDDYRNPIFIETLPKTGYRLILPIVPLPSASNGAPATNGYVLQNGLVYPPAPGQPGNVPPQRITRSTYPRHLWGLLGLVLVLMSSGFAWYQLSRSTTAAHTPAFRQAPLTSLPGAEFDPALSPNGNQVAFVWLHNDRYGLYVKQLDTETLVRLTDHEKGGFGPAWSPDGRHIAFIRLLEPGCEILTVPARGGPEQKLADCGANFMADLAWAPDGKALVYSDRPTPDAPLSIIRLSLETRQKTTLTHPPSAIMGDIDPAFSPDGRYVAFTRANSFMMRDVYVASASGGPAQRLTFRNASVEGLAWSPDGRYVIFSGGSEDNHGLWQVSLSGGAPEQVHLGNTSMRNPSFASKAGRLAGEHWVYDSNIWRLSLDEAGAPAGAPTPLITSTRRDYAPHYAPDGTRIAFTSNRSGSSEVWISRSDGTQPVRLTSLNAVFIGKPRWAPDGRHLVFEAHVDGNVDLYLTDADGSLPRRLTTDTAMDVGPRWSRDAQSIYFGSNRGDAWQVWKMPAAGGPATQVTQHGGLTAMESTDGAWLYFVKEDTTGLWRRPLQGNDEEQVVDLLPSRFWRSWTLTDTGLIFLHYAKKGRRISFFSFATGQLTPLVTPRYGGNLTISSDGKTLLYSQIDHQESDIMLVEGF